MVPYGGPSAIRPFLSPCADKYAVALANPFGDVGGACIPDGITLPSQKVCYTSRGNFNIGLMGVGWAVCNPFNMIQNGITGDPITGYSEAPVVATTGGYNGTTYTFPFTASGLTIGSSNSPFTDAAVASANFQFRLVGSGLRVRYAGSELNRSGRLLMYRERTNNPIPAVANINSLLLDNYYHTSPVDREWHEISYQPSRTTDISYSTWLPTTTSANTDYRIQLALIEGAAPNSLWEFEVQSCFEVIYAQSGIDVTTSHSDPTGFGAVLSAFPNRLIDGGKKLLNYVRKGAMDALSYATSGLITMGARAVGGYIAGPVGSAAAGLFASRATPPLLTYGGPTITEVE
jgi:hypothetical protein